MNVGKIVDPVCRQDEESTFFFIIFLRSGGR